MAVAIRKGPDAAGYIFWDMSDSSGMACDFIQILLLAAARDGLGPEDGIRETQVMMIGQRYAAAYRLSTISSFPAFNSPNAGSGPWVARRNGVRYRTQMRSSRKFGTAQGLLLQRWRVSSRECYRDCLMLSAPGQKHVPSLPLGAFVYCTMRSADGYRLC